MFETFKIVMEKIVMIHTEYEGCLGWQILFPVGK